MLETVKTKPVVLIVEDEPLVCDIAAEEFQDAGYSVLKAEDATEAMALLKSDERIDILFTDIRLPGAMDGWSIAKEARILRPNLPIMYATGYSADLPDLLENTRFYKKPYNLQNVISAAYEMIDVF